MSNENKTKNNTHMENKPLAGLNFADRCAKKQTEKQMD